jgi:hypothetical protein
MAYTIARMMSTISVWTATACILILGLGVFRADWSGQFSVFGIFFVVAVVCGTAFGSTATIWRLRTPGSTAAEDPWPDSEIASHSEVVSRSS